LAEFPWPAKTLDCGAHCAAEMSSRKLFFSAARHAITSKWPLPIHIALA
jgi:hypothetical protein